MMATEPPEVYNLVTTKILLFAIPSTSITGFGLPHIPTTTMSPLLAFHTQRRTWTGASQTISQAAITIHTWEDSLPHPIIVDIPAP